MKGIRYIVDDSGEHKEAVIDLEEWGDEWEDFCDGLTGILRKNEPLITWEVLDAVIESEKLKIG